MPKQEVFFEQQTGDSRIEVLKSYDQSYAREAFRNMDEYALEQLWKALKPEEIYDPAGLPSLNDANGEAEAFLWDELLEQAREDGSLLSFFIVNEIQARHTESLFVSPDWPSAGAKKRRRRYDLLRLDCITVMHGDAVLDRLMPKKMKSDPSPRTSVTFSSETYRTLEDIALKKKVSVAWVVREAAEKYIADQWPLFRDR
jgi:hypothetical protein